MEKNYIMRTPPPISNRPKNATPRSWGDYRAACVTWWCARPGGSRTRRRGVRCRHLAAAADWKRAPHTHARIGRVARTYPPGGRHREPIVVVVVVVASVSQSVDSPPRSRVDPREHSSTLARVSLSLSI